MVEETDEPEVDEYDLLLPPGEPEDGGEDSDDEEWEVRVSCGCVGAD